jgi:hypothetical protein
MQTKVRFKQNAIHIPHKNLFLVSYHRHDFITYTHDDGRYIFIDGGSDYIRVGGNLELYKEGIVMNWCTDSDFNNLDEIRTMALWGTRGKDGKQPLAWKPIFTFKRAHLRAIKKNCAHYMHPILLDVVKYWLKMKYSE